MNRHDCATAAIRIGDSLRARMFKDIMDTTGDPVERNEILAATLGHVLRKSMRDIPIPTDQQAWLAEIVKVAVA